MLCPLQVRDRASSPPDHVSRRLAARHHQNAVASVIGVATRDSFTKKSIKASFLNTGMHPFDESKIDASLEKYLGAASEKPALTAQEEAIRLTTNIAKEAFGASTPITKKTVRNAPAKSTMFTAEQMLAYDEERKQDAEKAKQSKSKKRKMKILKLRRRKGRRQVRRRPYRANRIKSAGLAGTQGARPRAGSSANIAKMC